jgi:hypothetical protein
MMRNLNKLAAIGSSIALGIGATACGSESTAKHQKPKARQAEISTKYFPNGTRELKVSGSISDDLNGLSHKAYPKSILQFCDGHDLVEETLEPYKDQGTSIERTVDYPACVNDGILTPADFSDK